MRRRRRLSEAEWLVLDRIGLCAKLRQNLMPPTRQKRRNERQIEDYAQKSYRTVQKTYTEKELQKRRYRKAKIEQTGTPKRQTPYATIKESASLSTCRSVGRVGNLPPKPPTQEWQTLLCRLLTAEKMSTKVTLPKARCSFRNTSSRLLLGRWRAQSSSWDTTNLAHTPAASLMMHVQRNGPAMPLQCHSLECDNSIPEATKKTTTWLAMLM